MMTGVSRAGTFVVPSVASVTHTKKRADVFLRMPCGTGSNARRMGGSVDPVGFSVDSIYEGRRVRSFGCGVAHHTILLSFCKIWLFFYPRRPAPGARASARQRRQQAGASGGGKETRALLASLIVQSE